MPTGVPQPSESRTRAPLVRLCLILLVTLVRLRLRSRRVRDANKGRWRMGGNQIIAAPWPADCCMRLRARRVMAVNFSLSTGAASAASCTDSTYA